MSRRFIAACFRLDANFPIVPIADWLDGKHRMSKDPVLLEALRDPPLILVGFDRRSTAMHAGQLTREGAGHAGVILYRRSVAQIDYGKQSRPLIAFWREAADWDWTDRIEYLPKKQ